MCSSPNRHWVDGGERPCAGGEGRPLPTDNPVRRHAGERHGVLGEWFDDRLVVLLMAAFLTGACGNAYRQAERSANEGDWDTAVAYYQRALQDDPERPEYRIALARAMINASRQHITIGRALEARGEFSAALREYRSAAEFDPSNSEVVARASTLERHASGHVTLPV